MSRALQLPEPTEGSEVTRAKIVTAARCAFRADGFDKASTRAIAAAAGVNSSLIFRYFGSKSGLYEVAVLAPLRAFLDDYVRRFGDISQEPQTAIRVATEYLGGLYDLFRGHRDLVLALVGSNAPAELGEEQAEIARWVAQLLDGVQVVVDNEVRRRGWSGFDDDRMPLRMALGLAFSMAVLQDWMFPDDGQRPTRDQIVASMVSYVLRSMSNPGGIDGIPDPSEYDEAEEARRTDASVQASE